MKKILLVGILAGTVLLGGAAKAVTACSGEKNVSEDPAAITRSEEELSPYFQAIAPSEENLSPYFQAIAPSEEDLSLHFHDIASSDWFYTPVFYNYHEELMTGLDAEHFGPYEQLSRAQFAMILYRMNGAPKVAYADKFSDVPEGDWYTDAVLWAADAGVVTGYTGTGKFGPADRITREQMSVMMHRYGTYLGYDMSKCADLDGFADADLVSPYANDALVWAVGTNIIFGKNEGTILDPQGNATRAECAAIIMRFLEYYKADYVDLSDSVAALMTNYMPNAKRTLYGGLSIEEITVNAAEAGTLSIGTAKVAELERARKYALGYTSDVTAYEVEKGENVISVSLTVAEDETIIIGGNGSVGVYYAQNDGAGSSDSERDGAESNDLENDRAKYDDESEDVVLVSEDHSYFSLVDHAFHKKVLSHTGGVYERLSVSVKVSSVPETHLSNLQEKEAFAKAKREQLKESVYGKNLSILADSISTYPGYSNDAWNANSTIGGNIYWYTGATLGSVNDTWWMQAVNETGMNLLVNNAWAGTRVLYSDSSAGYDTRPYNLHDDTGENAGTKPDIIVVYMGTNDFSFFVPLGEYSKEMHTTLVSGENYPTPQTFTEAYIIMMDKIAKSYERADLFCFTLLPNIVSADVERMETYNEVIRGIAEYYGAETVELYEYCGITEENYERYTIDGVHPTEIGMDMITEVFVDTLMERYAK